MEQPHYILEEMKDYNALREELTWHRNSIHGWRIQSRAQEKLLQSVLHKLNAKQRKLDYLTTSVDEKEQRLQYVQRELNVKQREFDNLTKSIKERNSEVDEKEKKLLEKAKDIEGQVKDLESNNKLYEVRVKVLETREKQCKLLKSKQIEVEQREIDLLSKEKQFIKHVKAHESKFAEREQEQENQYELLKTKQKEVETIENDLQSKEEQFEEKVKAHESKFVEREKEQGNQCELLKSKQKEVEIRENDLTSKQKQFLEQVRAHELKFVEREKEQQNQYELLKSKKKEVEQRENDLQSKEEHFEEQVKAHESKFAEREKEQGNQCELLKSKQKEVETIENDLQSKEEQFEEQVKAHESKFAEREKEQGNQCELLKSRQKEVEQRENDLQSKEEQFLKLVKAHESKFAEREKEQGNQCKLLKSKQKEVETRENDLQSKEEQFLEQVKAHESKFVERDLELESKEKDFDKRLEVLVSFEKQFEETKEVLVSKEKQLEETKKMLVSKEKQLEETKKMLVSKEKQLEETKKMLVSKEKQLEETKKMLVSKEKQFEETKEVLVSNEKEFNLRLKHLETKQNQEPFNLGKQLEFVRSQVTAVLRSSPDPAKLVLDTIKGFCPRNVRNLLVDELYKTSPVISSHVKEEAIKFATEWKKNFSVPAKDQLEVMDCLKFIATYDIGSYFQAPQVLCGPHKLPGNQLSPTTDYARNLQLISDESELNDNGILVDLQTAPSPAQLVLDIIRNPMIRRDEGIIIEKSQIFLLDQLMRFSPYIEPNVKDEAMKLALELKDAARGSAENSLVVLVFLYILSSYRLLPHSNFNEDEVLKLFEAVAHHKEAVELFGTLGFVHRISDFVDNLINKLRYIGAVRFICAYNLADKTPLVNGLLQLDIHKAKQNTDEVVNREKRREPKVMARETEIASLRDILKCISDYNLEYLYLVNDIKARILVLEQENQRENTVSVAIEPPSKENKRARKTVKVQQTTQKKPYDVAGTKNQVEVQQCRKRKRANEAVLEVPEHYQLLHQFGNNSKSLLKDVSSSSNSVPHYQQHAFIPNSEMPAAQFGNPNRAVLFRNEGGKSFQLSGTHL